MFTAGAVPLTVLPTDVDEGRRGLLQLQITVRSVLGSLVLNSGGLVVDGDWVRVFAGRSGRGSDGLPSLAAINAFPEVYDPAWRLGGVFALNSYDPAASGRPGEAGQMTYFAPDTLEWETMAMGHSAWVSWLLSGRLETFYEGLRWQGWREEASALSFSQGINVFPPLWSKEGRADLAAASRRAVPMREVLGVAVDTARQLGTADPGFLGQA
ncbi:hypothetical protein ABH920_004902 [Catenulispora sp. EB89]